MIEEVVIRQYFLDFLENLGHHVGNHEEYDEEECNQIIADLFFAGELEIKWNPQKRKLMLRPTKMILQIGTENQHEGNSS